MPPTLHESIGKPPAVSKTIRKTRRIAQKYGVVRFCRLGRTFLTRRRWSACSGNLPCVAHRGLLLFAAFSAGAVSRPHHLFHADSFPQRITVSIRSNTPNEQSFGPSNWIAAALLACLAAASGCNNIASQAANVEGVRLYQQGNYQQASDRFQQAIAQDPRSPEGYYNLAASLHKTGALYSRPSDLQQAENLYNQCLERDPNHTECYRGLAVLLNETGRQQDAFKLLNHWSSASPKSPDPKIELARLLEEVGQAEQAKAQLVDALTIDPHNARALTALGRLRDQSGDHQQALANYQRSLSLNRFQPEVAARVAQLQGAVGAPIVVPSAEAPRAASGMQPAVRY
jgi:Flp pilus assembly protein TadD